MKKIFLITVLLSMAFLFKACVQDEVYESDIQSSDIVLMINEVNSNAGDPKPDWIEIYNPGGTEIDLSGFGVYDKPAALFKLPAGTKIAAKGYYVVTCDVALAATDPTKYAAFGISSGGESVYLVDNKSAIIDEVAVPAMPLGITYARIPNGGTTFANANATMGTANSNTNNPPVITATAITNVNSNDRYTYNIVVSDASGVADVKFFYQTSADIIFTSMAPLGGGTYTHKMPLLKAGETVKYYVEATDATGLKTYFPATAPATPNSFVVIPVFNSVTLSTSTPSGGEPITVSAVANDLGNVLDVLLNYTVNSEDATKKIAVTMVKTNGIWTGIIPGQNSNSIVRYHLVATNDKAQKTYSPAETTGTGGVVTSVFDHTKGSTWPSVTVAPPPPIILNEICGLQTPDDDWVEIFNNSDAEYDVSGMKLIKDGSTGTALYTFPAGSKIAAKGYKVITTLPAGSGLLAGISNTKDVKIELTTATGAVISSFQKTATTFVGGHPADGSYSRSPNATGDWVVKTAHTKGAANN
jgi:hypothetical protein